MDRIDRTGLMDRGNRQGRSIAGMRSEWSRRTQRAGTSPAAEPVDAPPAPANAPLPLKTTGLLTTFTDAIGGSISLAHADGRIQHRGTVSVRGGGQTIAASARDIGLPDHVTRAFEFVAAWFGHPFDAVNMRAGDDRVLSWGFWPLSGDDLVRCLLELKRRAPETFNACCLAFGLDIQTTDKADSANSNSNADALIVRSDSRTVHGRAAEWAIASEPWLLAVLARTGRHPDAQRAQVELALANWITPILFQPWDPVRNDQQLTLDVLRSPHALATVFYLVRRHGQRGATRLFESVNARWQPEDDERAWIHGIVRSLRHAKREHDAAEVLRIASSPELATD